MNDGFGALSLSLAQTKPCMVTDSWVSTQGVLANIKHNHMDCRFLTLLNSLQKLPGPLAVAMIKLPKSQAMLQHQLYQLRSSLDQNTTIIAAAMARNIHSSTLKLFEDIIGPTRTSLARKKARLIFCERDEQLQSGNSPYPKYYTLEFQGRTFKICNHANVFSREKLDMGTRFFLQHLPQRDYDAIVDMGCGNGLLALASALQHPGAQFTLVDESYMAVASAKKNFYEAFGSSVAADFIVDDCLNGLVSNSVDLVLNNPPFHQQHVVGDQVAWRMFRDAHRVLKPHGELRVVANRHLAYHAKLKRLFGNCTTVASNRKFVILAAVKD